MRLDGLDQGHEAAAGAVDVGAGRRTVQLDRARVRSRRCRVLPSTSCGSWSDITVHVDEAGWSASTTARTVVSRRSGANLEERAEHDVDLIEGETIMEADVVTRALSSCAAQDLERFGAQVM